MDVLLLTMSVFCIVTLGMASGVILSRGQRQLQGSCGGPAFNPACCMTCPDKDVCDDEIASSVSKDSLVEIGGMNAPKPE